jgi:flagellin-like protein
VKREAQAFFCSFSSNKELRGDGYMKANRKFKEADERAVSAVIGVILMVAITVAIAATVYVYVSGMIGGTPKSGPKISWVPNTSTHTLTITKGALGFQYGSTSGNLHFTNSGNTYSVCTGTGQYEVQAPGTLVTTDIMAGDILHFPAAGTYTIIWVPTNEVLGTVTV